jgi:hypothetical protein
MDANNDGLLNFKELVQALEVICKGDHISKLKVFYCLHLPGIVLPGKKRLHSLKNIRKM